MDKKTLCKDRLELDSEYKQVIKQVCTAHVRRCNHAHHYLGEWNEEIKFVGEDHPGEQNHKYHIGRVLKVCQLHLTMKTEVLAIYCLPQLPLLRPSDCIIPKHSYLPHLRLEALYQASYSDISSQWLLELLFIGTFGLLLLSNKLRSL